MTQAWDLCNGGDEVREYRTVVVHIRIHNTSYLNGLKDQLRN